MLIYCNSFMQAQTFKALLSLGPQTLLFPKCVISAFEGPTLRVGETQFQGISMDKMCHCPNCWNSSFVSLFLYLVSSNDLLQWYSITFLCISFYVYSVQLKSEKFIFHFGMKNVLAPCVSMTSCWWLYPVFSELFFYVCQGLLLNLSFSCKFFLLNDKCSFADD